VFQFVTILVAGEVGADGGPGISSVVTAVEFLGAIVKTGVGMRTDKNG
jgi:hypothetical protein